MADIEKIFYFDDSYNDYSESPSTQYRGPWLSVLGDSRIAKDASYLLHEAKQAEISEIIQKYSNVNLELTMLAYLNKPASGYLFRSHIRGLEWEYGEIGGSRVEELAGPVTFRKLINSDFVKNIEEIRTFVDGWADCRINSHTNPQPPFLKITGDIPSIFPESSLNLGYVSHSGWGCGNWPIAKSSSKVFPQWLHAKLEIFSKTSNFREETTNFSIGYYFNETNRLAISYRIPFEPNSKLPLGEEFTIRMIGQFDIFGDLNLSLATFHTIDSTPNVPTLLSPNNTSVQIDSQNKFIWKHNIATYSHQLKFDLEYSLLNHDNWIMIANIESSDEFYIVPPSILPAGKIKWRVRTYNTMGVHGEWSAPANILAKGKPPQPIGLTTTTTQISTISWQAENQQGYRILINGNGISYDSNEIFGTEKQYKLPFFLKQGKRYELSVAIANDQGYWSDYTTTFINVQNKPMPTIKIICVRNINHVKFMWEHNSDYRKYLIYRDGIFLAETKSNQYEDWLAYKKHAYKVIAVGYNDFVKESEIVYKNCMMNFTNIHEIGKHKFIDVSKNIGSNLTVSSSLESNIAYHSFDGRQYPVAVSDGVVAKTHTLSVGFFNTEKEDIFNFENLVGKLACFKSVKQYALIGVLTINSKTQDQKYTQYEYTITEVTMSKEFDIND